MANKEFPNEITINKPIKLEAAYMRPLTKYLIGWDETINEDYHAALIDKKKKK